MMAKLWNYETTEGRETATHPMELAVYNSGIPTLITNRLTEKVRYYDLDIESSVYDVWMITGMALNLAHLIETTDLSVVDPETVLHSSASKMVLDEQLLADLKTQLGSYSDDKALALKIVPTIDYKSNYHLLWQPALLWAAGVASSGLLARPAGPAGMSETVSRKPQLGSTHFFQQKGIFQAAKYDTHAKFIIRDL